MAGMALPAAPVVEEERAEALLRREVLSGDPSLGAREEWDGEVEFATADEDVFLLDADTGRVLGGYVGSCLYVEPDFRGAGYGRELVARKLRACEGAIDPDTYTPAGWAAHLSASRCLRESL